MQLLAGQDKIQIDDTVGASFVVDLQTQAVTQTVAPPAARQPPPGTRPRFD